MVNNGSTYKCPECGRQRRAVKKKEVVKLQDYILKRERSILYVYNLSEEANLTERFREKLEEIDFNLDYFIYITDNYE